MTEWQDISTAPVGVLVHLGRWISRGDGSMFWHDGFYIAKERWLWGLFTRLTYDGKRYSHWKPAPPPPATGE